MTDAPAATAPTAADVTPPSYAGPLWLVAIPSFASTIVVILQHTTDASGQVKQIAENLGVGWALPYVALALAIALSVAVNIGALVWLYRRGLSRGRKFPLWFRSQMPWNKAPA